MARKSFGITIDNNTLEQIANTIIEASTQEVSDIISPDIMLLKQKSLKFLQIVKETQEKIQNIEKIMLTQKKLRTQIRKELGVTGRFLTQYETQEYSQNKEWLSNELHSQEIDKLYQAAFEFHEDLNKILGQEVITVIVLQDDEGNPILFDANKADIFNNNILNYEETSKTSRLTARFKVNIDEMKQAGMNAINRDDLDINDNLNLQNLNEVYKNVLYRYDTYKRLVLWLFPKNIWNWAKVSARGDIAEAYSMFFLKKAEYDFQNDLEQNIHYFMVLGVQEVDNVSGLLQGDISSGQYEYAIKSADASYMSIQQMIPLAEKIVTKPNYTLLDLQNYKQTLHKKKAKIRNPIYNSLDNVVSTSVQEAINNINI